MYNALLSRQFAKKRFNQTDESGAGVRTPGHPASPSSRSHVLPISSLRFVLALVVAISHSALPSIAASSHQPLLRLAGVILRNAFAGMPAVIVFFVISGFCIHYPNRRKLEIGSWKVYYARRYLRILIPMAVAIALAGPLHLFKSLPDSVLWSLFCEEIYYLVYPGLILLRNRIGWRGLMTIAWVVTYVHVATRHYLPDLGMWVGTVLTAIWALPTWLLGCKLAEESDSLSKRPIASWQIWAWRTGAWLCGSGAMILTFHSHVGYSWTLPLLGLYSTYWLQHEIRYYRQESRRPMFEKLGESSYSIYLTHVHGFALAYAMPFAASLSAGVFWLSRMAVSAAFATAFYFLIEKPSHQFARRYSKRVRSRQAVPAA